MAKLLGKILKGVGKVVGIAAAGAAIIGTGGALAGAVPLIAKGTGLLGKIFKGTSKVSQSAVNLVTGTTKAERVQVKGVKVEAKAAQDKLDQVERLVNAGATRTQAMAMAGVTAQDLGSADAMEKDQEAKATITRTGLTEVTKAGPGCLVILAYLASGALTIGLAILTCLLI